MRWIGRAASAIEVETIQVTAYDVGTTYTLTRNGKSVSTIAAGSANATATALAAAWNASTETELAEVTALATTDTISVTSDTTDIEIGPITGSVSGGTGTIDATPTVTTHNGGVHDADVAANYSTAAKPVNSDTLVVDNGGGIDILYGLDQSAVTLTLLQIDQSYEGKIGNPERNTTGTEYEEDRPLYYKIKATSAVIGRGPGQGSGRIKWDASTAQTAVLVENTGSPESTNLEALLWKGTHASNTFTASGNASVGVAVFGGEVATIATLTVKDNATIRIGSGVTLAAVVVYGGNVTINCAVTTSIIMYGGTVTVNGTGAVALAQVWGGTLVYNSTGALGGASIVGDGGTIDFSQDARTKTVTNALDVFGSGIVNDPNKSVTTLIIDYNGTTPLPNLGTNFRITRAATA